MTVVSARSVLITSFYALAIQVSLAFLPSRVKKAHSLYHGSRHKHASEHDVTGKRVIVVGTGNSGHDIAQNFYENGAASVTMLQRSVIHVLNVDIGGHMLHQDLYDETGPPTEDADIFGQSLPMPVQFALGVETIKDTIFERVLGSIVEVHCLRLGCLKAGL